jgi:hypothetical protein
VDAAYTRKELGWKVIPRYRPERRILHVIEHMKTYPIEWHQKNALALYKSPERPNLAISEALVRLEDPILTALQDRIMDVEQPDRYSSYKKMDPEKLAWYLGIVYNLLKVSVRTGDRLSMSNYARFIASIRIHEGFKLLEVVDVYETLAELVIQQLLDYDSVKHLEERIRDDIDLTIQMAVDEIEDAYDIAKAPASYVRFHNR